MMVNELKTALCPKYFDAIYYHKYSLRKY